jgi:hypothetical protein
MLSLAERGIDPSVVDDQSGRLTFTSGLARAIRHLVDKRAHHGTYNVAGSGTVTSWADIAARVFSLHGPDRVTGVSTDAYFASATTAVSRRPPNRVLGLSRIEATGFRPHSTLKTLGGYLFWNHLSPGDPAKPWEADAMLELSRQHFVAHYRSSATSSTSREERPDAQCTHE